MMIGPIEHKTNIRFKKMEDLDSYINAKDVDYECEDATLTGYVYIINTLQFKVVTRSAHAKGTNCIQQIVEYHGKNC